MKKVLTVFILICMAVSYSATITWRKYREFTSDVTIDAGDQLIIEAGTTLRFAPSVKLSVYGEIKALGTEAEPIIFTALDRGEVQWGGIIIDSPSGVNEFSFTSFKFMNGAYLTGNAGMNIFQSEVTFNNCYFSDSYGDVCGGALRIISGNVNIYNTEFYGNQAQYGGAVYINNDCINGKNTINIEHCKFVYNYASSGGALAVEDNRFSAYNMDLNISNCVFTNQEYINNGGAFFYSNQGKIDLTFEKSVIYSNQADRGSAIHASFMTSTSGNILPQKFTNLLIFKNAGYYQSGIYIDMGQTLNPQNLVITNNTIAFNQILPSKQAKDFTSGIYIKSNGNFPKIANTILWGNTDHIGINNYWIDDDTNPLINDIFWYCDIQNYEYGGTNLSLAPVFIRPPMNSNFEHFYIDTYDFHLRLFSPCIDAGDPEETCFEPNSSRVNIGAYGNTYEAAKGNFNTVAPTSNTDVSISDNTATVLDFTGKPAGTLNLLDLQLGVNSEVYIKKSAADTDTIRFTNIITSSNDKFDDSFARIQTMDVNTPVQNICVSGSILLQNTDMYNIMLTAANPQGSSVSATISNSKFYADSILIGTTPYALDLVNASNVNIENCTFTDYVGGIRINPESLDQTGGNKSKASGRIANNSVRFEPTPSSKAGSQKQIGIEIANSNIDIEDNEIDGGDEGIVMKTGSSGRISNNSVRFEPTASSKGDYIKKGIVVTDNSNSSDISNNIITNDDWENSLDVVGIEIENSQAVISYNQLRYGSYDIGPRTGINLVSPQSGTAIFNNTIFGCYTAFGNSPSASIVDITNNIFWSWDSTSVEAVNDTTNLRFYNNCFLTGLPEGITGSDNFNLDPEFFCDYTGDFNLASTSPCINAGKIIDGVHSFASSKTVYYYGSAPDVGAEEFWQDSQPVSVETSVSGTDFTFSWDSVDGFTNYAIYASDVPFGSFTKIEVVSSTNYTASIGSAKKFYYVAATTDPVGKYSESEFSQTETTKSVPRTIIDRRTKAKNLRINNQQKR